MLVRKARFKKFDEGGIEEESNANPSGGVFGKSIFRNVRNSSFAPLVEDDFSVPSTSSNVLWDDRRQDDKLTFPDDPFDSLAHSARRVSTNAFNVVESKQKPSEQKNKVSKIPQLKANRLDDLHYHRAKELVDMMDKQCKIEAKHATAPIDLTDVKSDDTSGWVHFENKMNDNDAAWSGFPPDSEPLVEQTGYEDFIAPIISEEEEKVTGTNRQVGASLGAISSDSTQDEDSHFAPSLENNEVDDTYMKRKRKTLDEARLYDESLPDDTDDMTRSQDVFLSLNVGLQSGVSHVEPAGDKSTMKLDFVTTEDVAQPTVVSPKEENLAADPETHGHTETSTGKQETSKQGTNITPEVFCLEKMKDHHGVEVASLSKPQLVHSSLETSSEKQDVCDAKEPVFLSVRDTIVLEQGADGEAVEIMVHQITEQPLEGSEHEEKISTERISDQEALDVPIVGMVESEPSTPYVSHNEVELDSPDNACSPLEESSTDIHARGKDLVGNASHPFHSSLPTMDTIAEDSPQDDDLPNLEQSLSHQSTYVAARSHVRLGNSIHFRKMSPSSNSLLDTASDFHSDVGDEPSVSDSVTQHSKAGRVIQLTKSSGSLSTITYPHQLSRSYDETSMQPSKTDSKTRLKLEPEETGATSTTKPSGTIAPSRDLPFIPTGGVKPLGATTEEIIMLNTFMQIAAPKLKGSTLTLEDREEIHLEARQAGLPEEYINKLLDQSAGIMCWDDQSVSTVHTADVTEAGTISGQSVKTKGTVSTASTGYTRDSEAISYYSYETGYKTPKSEALGGFGCFFESFKKSFWAEAGLAGDDIMENVTAAISSDSADSWDSH